MRELNGLADPDIFAKKLSQARECALLLDYDGTLAPFHVERDRAFPYPGVSDALAQIIALGNTQVVIVTGRLAAEVPPLLGLERQRLDIWGCDGWERLRPDGRYHMMIAEPEAREGVAIAYNMLLALACGRFRNTLKIDRHVERTPGGLTLHWRGWPPEVIDMLRDSVTEEWVGIARDAGLELWEFEEDGLELRFPGRSKATAVQSIINETSEDAAVAYVGDDLSDEEAFRALKGRGLGVLVRSEVYPTAADLWLRPPQGLRDFLWLWEELRSRAALTQREANPSGARGAVREASQSRRVEQ